MTVYRLSQFKRKFHNCCHCLLKVPESPVGASGKHFVVRHCRVGILNEIGELLKPQVAILLIGERPGLASAESMSAYMAYQPEPVSFRCESKLNIQYS